MVMAFLRGLDRLIGRVVAATKWLALPLVVLLFLQWPLREFFRAFSREANDLGQIAFALFVAVSVTAATRAGTHLASDALAYRYSPRARHRLRQIGALVAVLPWAVFVVVASKPFVVLSVAGLESFPDSYNPGYFIIKAALWLLALLMIAQAVIDILRPQHSDSV